MKPFFLVSTNDFIWTKVFKDVSMNYRSTNDESYSIVPSIIQSSALRTSVSDESNRFHYLTSSFVLDECFANPCRSGIATCRNGTRCIPMRNNDANSYKCLCDDNLSSFSSSTLSNSDCSISTMDHCSLRPCEPDQQCINVYPNNYTCICSNCSSSMGEALRRPMTEMQNASLS